MEEPSASDRFAVTIEHLPPYEASTRSWELKISRGDSLATAKLTDPFTDDDEEDLKWALEEYALSQPFEKGRAVNVHQKIANYAQKVFGQLRESIYAVLPAGTANQPIVLLITAPPDEGSLHRIHWESLEYLDEVKIFIRRQIGGRQTTAPISSPLVTRKKIQLFLLTARSITDEEEDVSYTLVSRVVSRIISALPDSSQTTLHLVRPGTFNALKRALKDNSDPDASTIVHFDCHGSVSNGTSYLSFLSKDDNGRLSSVDSKRIGKLLAQHHVSMVIMNACDSARAGHGVSADLAAALLQQGIPYVVGMRKKLLTSSAPPLLEHLYRNLFVSRMDPFSAMYHTRRRLHTIRTRTAVLSVEVEVDDYLIPVLYEQDIQTEESSLLPAGTGVTTRTLGTSRDKPGPESRTVMVGRDFDLLRVETTLTLQSSIIELTGVLGCGKTHFLQHASRWWKATNFIDVVLWHDKPGKLTPFSVAYTIHQQANIKDSSQQVDPDQVIQGALKWMSENRCLLVIDQVDQQIQSMNEQEKKDFVEFLQQIDEKKTFVVIALGKWNETTLDFPPLELPTLSDNATHELALATAKSRRTFDLQTVSDRAFFQQCMAITGNLPLLAVMTGNWLGAHLDATPETVFTHLVCGGGFEAMQAHPPARRLVEYLKSRLATLRTNEERIALLSLAPNIRRLRKSSDDLHDRLVLLGVLPDNPTPFGDGQLDFLMRTLLSGASTNLPFRSGGYYEWNNLINSLRNDGLIFDHNDVYWSVHPLLPFTLQHVLQLPETKDILSLERAYEAFLGQYRSMSEKWMAQNPLSVLLGTGSGPQAYPDKAASALQEDFLNCYSAVRICISWGPKRWHPVMPWRLIQFAGELTPCPPPGFNNAKRLVLVDLLKQYLAQYDRTSMIDFCGLCYRHSLELGGNRKPINGDSCVSSRTAVGGSLALSRYYFFRSSTSDDFRLQLKKTESLFQGFNHWFSQDQTDQDTLNMAGQIQLLSSLASLGPRDWPDLESAAAQLQAATSNFSTSSPSDTVGQYGLATSRMLSELVSLANANQGAQPASEQSVATLSRNTKEVGRLYDAFREDYRQPIPSFAALMGMNQGDPAAFENVHPSTATDLMSLSRPRVGMDSALDSAMLSNLGRLQELGDEGGQIKTLVGMAQGAVKGENWADALVHLQTTINLLRDSEPGLFSKSRQVRNGKELQLAVLFNWAAWAAGNLNKTVQCQEYLMKAYDLCSFEGNSPTHRIFLLAILNGLLHYGGEPIPGRECHPLAFPWLVELAMIRYDRSLTRTIMAALFNVDQLDAERGVGLNACQDMLEEERDGTLFERLYLCFLSTIFCKSSDERKDRLIFITEVTGAPIDQLCELLKDISGALNTHMEEITARAGRGEDEPLYREAERVVFGKDEDCTGFTFLPKWERKALRTTWPS
ncbi:hypothetical protein EDB81DRAFT_856654 [Dactylonectria macrodidyma]|uniref:CHAT domain-containing protein n=1 Tax=Dactylonectria macrodidyma TaxID=307937 RepID=A0A9P9EWZ8_9HYPO|nr:hypothetical protein EDB81DRAFT_856654 [Dactylonectria macrodidyma]